MYINFKIMNFNYWRELTLIRNKKKWEQSRAFLSAENKANLFTYPFNPWHTQNSLICNAYNTQGDNINSMGNNESLNPQGDNINSMGNNESLNTAYEEIIELFQLKNEKPKMPLSYFRVLKSKCHNFLNDLVLKDANEYSSTKLINVGEIYLFCCYCEAKTTGHSNMGFLYYWLLQKSVQLKLCNYYKIILNELPPLMAKKSLIESLSTFIEFTKSFWDAALNWKIGYLEEFFLQVHSLEIFVLLFVEEKIRYNGLINAECNANPIVSSSYVVTPEQKAQTVSSLVQEIKQTQSFECLLSFLQNDNVFSNQSFLDSEKKIELNTNKNYNSEETVTTDFKTQNQFWLNVGLGFIVFGHLWYARLVNSSNLNVGNNLNNFASPKLATIILQNRSQKTRLPFAALSVSNAFKKSTLQGRTVAASRISALVDNEIKKMRNLVIGHSLHQALPARLENDVLIQYFDQTNFISYCPKKKTYNIMSIKDLETLEGHDKLLEWRISQGIVNPLRVVIDVEHNKFCMGGKVLYNQEPNAPLEKVAKTVTNNLKEAPPIELKRFFNYHEKLDPNKLEPTTYISESTGKTIQHTFTRAHAETLLSRDAMGTGFSKRGDDGTETCITSALLNAIMDDRNYLTPKSAENHFSKSAPDFYSDRAVSVETEIAIANSSQLGYEASAPQAVLDLTKIEASVFMKEQAYKTKKELEDSLKTNFGEICSKMTEAEYIQLSWLDLLFKRQRAVLKKFSPEISKICIELYNTIKQKHDLLEAYSKQKSQFEKAGQNKQILINEISKEYENNVKSLEKSILKEAKDLSKAFSEASLVNKFSEILALGLQESTGIYIKNLERNANHSEFPVSAEKLQNNFLLTNRISDLNAQPLRHLQDEISKLCRVNNLKPSQLVSSDVIQLISGLNNVSGDKILFNSNYDALKLKYQKLPSFKSKIEFIENNQGMSFFDTKVILNDLVTAANPDLSPIILYYTKNDKIRDKSQKKFMLETRADSELQVNLESIPSIVTEAMSKNLGARLSLKNPKDVAGVLALAAAPGYEVAPYFHEKQNLNRGRDVASTHEKPSLPAPRPRGNTLLALELPFSQSRQSRLDGASTSTPLENLNTLSLVESPKSRAGIPVFYNVGNKTENWISFVQAFESPEGRAACEEYGIKTIEQFRKAVKIGTLPGWSSNTK